MKVYIFCFLRIMVYTVTTGFIELTYEQTLVPGVLITSPKKIPSILKDEEAAVSSPRHLPSYNFV